MTRKVIVAGAAITVLLMATAAAGFVRLGGKWHDPALPAPWRLNTFHDEPSIPGTDEFQDIRDSFVTWENVAGARIAFQEGVPITGFSPCGLQSDGQNVVSMRDCLNQCTSPCLAVTSTTAGFGLDYSQGGVGYLRNLENDITFTKSVLWITQAQAQQGCAGRFVLKGVATHEIGHLIGLGHSFAGTTMFASTGPCNLGQASLHSDDIAGTVALYDETVREYQVATHDVNNVRYSANNFGNIGVSGGAPGIGVGFEFPVGVNHIFEGSLIFAAAGDTNVSDDYRIQGQFTLTQDADFTPLTDIAIMTPGILTDQETIAEWDDSAASRTGALPPNNHGPTTPLGIRIAQQTYACVSPPDDDYIIVEYTLTNQSGGPITDLNVGLIIDWDFNGFFNTNSIGYDPGNGLGFVSDPSTTNRAGVRVLNAEGVRSYRALVSSGAGADIYMNATKAQWLVSGFGLISLSNRDIGMLIVTGPYTLAAGESAVAAFAIIAGTSLPDLQANSQAAQIKYDTLIGTTAVSERSKGVIGPTFRIEQNRPNPFNPATRIAYSMERDGQVSLRVFDTRGHLVRTLVDEPHAAGVHEVVWDGRDDGGAGAASGVYFYELRVDGELIRARKMQLLR